MNLDMVRPKNKTEEVLLSTTKYREQTHTKLHETLEFKLKKTKKNILLQTTNLK